MNSSGENQLEEIPEEALSFSKKKVYKDSESSIKNLTIKVSKALESVDLISTEVGSKNKETSQKADEFKNTITKLITTSSLNMPL